MKHWSACFLAYLSMALVACQREPCPFDVEIDITNGTQIFDVIEHNNQTYSADDYFRKNGRVIGCLCGSNTCVNKCCALGYLYVKGKCQKYESELTIEIYDVEDLTERVANIFPTVPCTGRKIRLEPSNYVEDKHFVQVFGEVYMPDGQATKNKSHDEYCVENVLVNGSVSSHVFLCIKNPVEMTNMAYSYGMIISMPFLLATFLAYAFLPDRNLPAKALMCYVLSLLLAYILLVTIQLNSNISKGPCVSIAILCYFFFMVSFFWMNSSCIDIWLTFSGLKGLVGSRKQNENKRFLYYSAYSWGVPLILVCLVIGITYSPHVPLSSKYHTGVGDGQCWFRNGLPTGLYFYFPIAVLLIINLALFGVTAYKINVIKNDIKVLKEGDNRAHRYENDKQRFNLYLKLLLAMGLNWSMEVISWAVNWAISSIPEAVWYLTDFCNALYGVFIFFIFVFKRNIWMLLKKRYLQLTGKPQQAHQLGTSSSAARTAVSQVTSEA